MSPKLRFETELAQATDGAECVIVVAVPSRFLREVTARLPRFRGIAVSVTKGIEDGTGLTMTGILRATMSEAAAGGLVGAKLRHRSGAGHSRRHRRGAPGQRSVAKTIQRLFHSATFRVYTSTDLLGVEMGGALKNVVAIAAGVGDGLGFGDNTKAALITRAMAEIRRLGVACGASAETFSGLSGLGDLTVTCFSHQSRNAAALASVLGAEKPSNKSFPALVEVVEGYPNARSAHHLASKLGIETPIVREVFAMLYENKNVRQAVQSLMSRDMKHED